ncbi:fatty acid-binding protein [Biomphalaria pfeifferi]|uniref:Fatty acid-binding protein n=1 Tax=Biomphalaria pfeifferi TaxID=112525 RepID=A0AAD8FFQ7_BIOPF|nr:fatty acid-binding protein [Biomphalaria pfeifferi]
MVERLLGHWKSERSENFDEYMKANDVNFVLRKVGNTITSYEEISKDGDTWTVHITSTFRSSKLVFKLGEPFTELTLDGRNVKSTFSIEGEKLACRQEPIDPSNTPSYITREVLEDGRMLITCIATEKNVTAKKYYVSYKP